MSKTTINSLLWYMTYEAAADAAVGIKKLRVMTEVQRKKDGRDPVDDAEKLREGLRLINEALGIRESTPIMID